MVVQGDPAAKVKIEGYLKSNLVFIHPRPGTEYSVKVVKPAPNIDYKIMMVEPDPDIDYKIIVLDRKTGKEIPAVSSEIKDAILKALKQKKRLGK